MVNDKRVLLGMSGGVDSSVAAFLLQKEGFDVRGVFMKNFSESKNDVTHECSWREELRVARRVADHLNISLEVLDSEAEYRRSVLIPMFNNYKRGLTPNPDISCNTLIKFPLFWKLAKKINADYIATGHYARIKKLSDGSFDLLRGIDSLKDQSYFLSGLTQKDLSHSLFPIGNFKKDEVRRIAKRAGLLNFDKQGTRGICFVGEVDMKSFLEQKIKNKVGPLLSPEGEVIGEHPGSFYFTNGQRVGNRLGMTFKKHLEGKWYVADKKKNNQLVLAPEGHEILLRKSVNLVKFNQVNPSLSLRSLKLKARTRHLGILHQGKLAKVKNKWSFTFVKPVEGLAEGQSLVLYSGTSLVASGEMRF